MNTSHPFITGGAKRIGKAIALHYASQGCKEMTLHYHHSHEEAQHTCAEVKAHGTLCHLVQAHFMHLHDAASLFAQAHIPITTLILNASLFQKDNLATLTNASLSAHMHINLTAPLLLIHAFMQQLKGEQGHIICMLDGMKGWSMSPQFLSYSLSKNAMEAFIEMHAKTFAPQVRINGIALGATLTGEMEKIHTLEKVQHASPLQQLSNIQEVLSTIDFLDKTPSITGQIIRLDGGLHLT
jgi:NAD(P)-dependent dehydrogenase (short-subunit alcohol dehydrogenase family)